MSRALPDQCPQLSPFMGGDQHLQVLQRDTARGKGRDSPSRSVGVFQVRYSQFTSPTVLCCSFHLSLASYGSGKSYQIILIEPVERVTNPQLDRRVLLTADHVRERQRLRGTRGSSFRPQLY